MVTGDIIVGSSSRGILIVIYTLNPDYDINYSYVPHSTTHPGVYSVRVELPDDQYQVAVFVVDENGEPFPRAVSKPKSVYINSKGLIITTYVNTVSLI